VIAAAETARVNIRIFIASATERQQLAEVDCPCDNSIQDVTTLYICVLVEVATDTGFQQLQRLHAFTVKPASVAGERKKKCYLQFVL